MKIVRNKDRVIESQTEVIDKGEFEEIMET